MLLIGCGFVARIENIMMVLDINFALRYIIVLPIESKLPNCICYYDCSYVVEVAVVLICSY